MDAAAIEETNRLRVSLGMKPLPVPGASGPQFKEKETTEEDTGSTLETREAAAYDNYKKIQDAEQAKKKREEKAAAIKKARDAAKRYESLQGKGLGEADEGGDVDTKSWLISQKKRQKQIDKARKLEEELAAAEAEAAAAIQYTSKDLAGVKVGHEIDSFEDGEEQILTLKDTDILGDEEGDELENINLREHEKLSKKLELKKKKPVYDPHAADETGERSLLAQYDEEIDGKKSKRFTLDGLGNTVQIDDLDGQPRSLQRQKINLDFLKDDVQPSSDYLDVSEVKIKKPKKKKTKTTRQRPIDEGNIFPLPSEEPDQSMDIDSGNAFINRKRKTDDSAFVDDEDLQATLAAQRRNALKKRKRMRPEDIAKQLREEAQTPEVENEDEGTQGGGLVLDEISEFVSGLTKEDIEDRKPRKPKSPRDAPVTAMEEESDEDEPMKDGYDVEHDRVKREASTPAETAVIGVDEEKTIGSGVGATLQLLRERQLLKDTGSAELNEKQRQHQLFLAEKKRRLAEMEQEARNQRERDRNSGRLDRMSVREREEWARQQNNIRDQHTSRQLVDLFNKGYKPNVELKYHDEHGRSLDQKEAFKHLSHQFHGKGSGKGKTDKRLKKIEDEKRRESQSMLDASQNVGMSSATAQQTKKRKEAGVRLA
ncbi:SART-1 protein [Hypoxylon trugodes]|uniref:SART-1 protein n=1 Tax=Hypoxylon trugodes TaxID=326681 RepID=UPI002196F211|nr:SART-1 protein [Hypoxylon trugodes]KAI1388319.1 SART-1 protein [Hypoxylon trugodes]